VTGDHNSEGELLTKNSKLKRKKNTFEVTVCPPVNIQSLFFLSLAPQPSLGLGLFLKIWLNFLEASQQFFYRVGLLAPRPTLIPEDQAPVFISPRGRVATHFSRLLRHAWVMVGLFLFPSHHTGKAFYAARIQTKQFSPVMTPKTWLWKMLSSNRKGYWYFSSNSTGRC
jgi:hypothetical protein